jgi:hypothetical protein
MTSDTNLPRSTYAIITPSYALDYIRCRLLCHSISCYVPATIPHYIIVDDHDTQLFQSLEMFGAHILPKSSLLPSWIWKRPLRIPFIDRYAWLSWWGWPIRGWIIQQIIKIAAASQIAANVFIFADSDVVFIRPFTADCILKEGRVRLFRRPDGITPEMPGHPQWMNSASRLLGLPQFQLPAPDYIGQLISWRRDTVSNMCSILERRYNKSWIEIVSECWYFSEYILYGVFVENFREATKQHYVDEEDICHCYWPNRPLSRDALGIFLRNIQDRHVAVMISAKSGTNVYDYASLLGFSEISDEMATLT